MSVGTLAQDLETRNGKPAHVTFRTIEKHMPKQSNKEGRYISKDVDMAEVRQLGSVDSIVWEVEKWFANNELEVKAERLNPAHDAYYREAYRRWKAGQEEPVEGTPIKSWPVISPAQVGLLLSIGIRTVEDLSTLTDEGVKRIGMGGVDFKNKAKAWLAASQDKGKLTQEMSALQRKNDVLEGSVANLTAQVEELKKMLEKPPAQEKGVTIDASDLLEDEIPKPRKR